jgi:probable F420-dependent oxidoreductase
VRFSFPLPHMLELASVIQPWERAVDGAEQTRAIKRAEALGYDMINVCEHFVLPAGHRDASGAFYFSATAAQGYILGATERMRVGSTITLLPLQHPIVMAKSLATLDWMSGGRLVAGFGVGWLEEEFRLLGVPFHERGRLADEYIAAIVELWTSDDPQFEGEHVSFREVLFAPRPVQQPHPPIWMGGDVPAVFDRIARFATGWIPFLTPPERFPEVIDGICSHPAYRDRGHPFEVCFSLASLGVGEQHVHLENPVASLRKDAGQITDQLNWLKGLGVTCTGAPLPYVSDLDEYLDVAQWFIEEIAPNVR